MIFGVFTKVLDLNFMRIFAPESLKKTEWIDAHLLMARETEAANLSEKISVLEQTACLDKKKKACLTLYLNTFNHSNVLKDVQNFRINNSLSRRLIIESFC